MKKIIEFLKNAGTFYLATDEDGQPRVRPFGAVCEFEGKLYITTNNKKDVYNQMMKNPKVEISGMVGGEWIRLTGKLTLDGRREARVAMLEGNPGLTSMYSADDNLMAVFYFTEAVAKICSFTSEPEVIKF